MSKAHDAMTTRAELLRELDKWLRMADTNTALSQLNEFAVYSVLTRCREVLAAPADTGRDSQFLDRAKRLMTSIVYRTNGASGVVEQAVNSDCLRFLHDLDAAHTLAAPAADTRDYGEFDRERRRAHEQSATALAHDATEKGK